MSEAVEEQKDQAQDTTAGDTTTDNGGTQDPPAAGENVAEGEGGDKPAEDAKTE